MKHEWKKYEREIYGAKKQPQLVEVPRQNFITINGRGNPNETDFSERVGVLYSLAYAIKMRFKAMMKECSQFQEERMTDYTVFPLEGIWSTDNPTNPLNKEQFRYTIMIRQPDAITEKMFIEALEVVKTKKPHPLLNEINFDTMEDGRSVQMLHIGSFDDEPTTFAAMQKFIEEIGLEKRYLHHREIYLNDARRTTPEKRKTILRFQVK